MSHSYAPSHKYNRRPHPNNCPPRFRKTFNQSTRRESHDSNCMNEEHPIPQTTDVQASSSETNSYSRDSFSSKSHQNFLDEGDRHHRYMKRNTELHVVGKQGSSSKRGNGFMTTNKECEEKTNNVPSQASGSQNYVASGSVIDGRYVRKCSFHSTSQLNADAPPFIPKLNTENINKSKHVVASFKQRSSSKKYLKESHHSSSYGTPPTRGYSSHSKITSPNHQKNMTFRPKAHKCVMKKSSLHEVACGSELYSDDGEYNDYELDNEESFADMLVTPKVDKCSTSDISKPKESITQRERLISQLTKGESECLVCCELIRRRDYVWSCSNCYHVFHLRCIKKWAHSPSAIVQGSTWRCPACQNAHDQVPFHYYCFCGKCKEPELNLHLTPHACGDVCGKQRLDEQCVHPCNLLCHPGPCPPCTATVTRTCACGKLQKMVTCSRNEILTCSDMCGKILNCSIHTCEDTCHMGDCKPCTVIVIQECFCGREERSVLCTASTAGSSGYSCGNVCDKKLDCGNHLCSAICHYGDCVTCNLLPETILACPCGKTPLKDLLIDGKPVIRHSCIDPIPVCGSTCGKPLSCGPKGNPHKCSSDCHLGSCPPCNLTTTVKCRCDSTYKEMPCVEVQQLSDAFLCEKRCNRRKDCGRHKCLNNCCVSVIHKCQLVCNKKLSCGLHYCQETCHAGNCHTCWNVSFDELRCHCGQSVRYPPVPCGAKPPECDQPCVRPHPCDHKVQHTCHSEETCPPCTSLTVKWCFGHHERRTIQCYLDGISCGKHCNKPLPCGKHKCLEICHSGTCLKRNTTCNQPCDEPRTCGHPCAAPCHEGPCPTTTCRAKVEVHCPCGQRTETVTCSEDHSAYRLMSVSILASKIQDIKAGESVNIGDLFSKKGKTSRLQCNEACAVYERNKRLAVALQIQNPDLSCKPGPPAYSEFLKEEAKKNLKFVCEVYDKIVELVELAKQSKQKSRSYAFPVMKRDQRRVVHELAEFFGCETQSYDEEPMKNVVVTAFRDKCWLPFVSIAAVVEREMGLRRGPNPIVSLTTAKNSTTTVNGEKKKTIDYFDYTDE